ncbi:uncharacterized protein [Drosophila tropicalis]|uniref:uncharacterized protein n=1 Tax=Drosophila tropicalis TaxID=46794 RepID=UPI0035ABB11E
MKLEEFSSTTAADPEIQHPNDGQYIWLPILVLVGIFFLAGLVYAMSRSRCLSSSEKCWCWKRRNNIRNGYINVDDEDFDSDVSMACGDEFGENRATACLLNGRLHIDSRPSGHQAHSPIVNSLAA